MPFSFLSDLALTIYRLAELPLHTASRFASPPNRNAFNPQTAPLYFSESYGVPLRRQSGYDKCKFKFPQN
jgi:hypothetical protein